MAGIRDSKTVDGVTYNYLTLDGKVVRQTWGSNVLDIIYDNSGLPYALKYNGAYYIYVLNQQGDVIRIVNSTGATVAEYRYDAWGNVIYSNGSMAAINPIRYRGYYYDTETGFYYLQSRYYDPSIGRFINADSQFDSNATFTGLNLFAYCANNPVIHKDLNGGSLLGACILIGAGIGALIGGTSGALIASNNGLTIEDGWDYVKHIVVGVAIGGTVGSAAGYVFAGTQMAASISWSFYKATHTIGTTAYAIGHAFEEWFYKAYNVVSQQVRHMGFRFDAVLNNTIIELKNYNWSKYSSYSSLIKRFTKQALNYLQFIGSEINGQIIKNVTFWFSSQPPQEIIDALRAIGVTVRWN